MEPRRTKTRAQDHEELLRRYRELQKERESCSGGKESSAVTIYNGNTSEPEEKDELALPSQKMSKIGVLQDDKDSSEELSENENTSHSDSARSSDTMYLQEKESSSGDDMESSTDDDKANKPDDIFEVSTSPSCIDEDEEVNKEKRTKSKKIMVVEPELMTGGSTGSGKREREVTEETTCVAQRLRSRRCLNSTELKTDNDVIRVLNFPVTLSDDELDCLQEKGSVGHGNDTTFNEVRDNGMHVCIDTEKEIKGKRKVGHPPKNLRRSLILINEEQEGIGHGNDTTLNDVRGNINEKEIKLKRKLGRPAKIVRNASISINEILVDSIWEKKDAQLQKLVSSPDEVETTLPLKFCFYDSDMELSETSDVEVEKLFEEMDYCMELLSLGASDSVMVDSEENFSSNTKKDPASACLDGGDHHLVLDEQIGLRCTICHFIFEEIRDIVPDFSKHEGGRAAARDFNRVDYSDFNAVQFEDFTASQLPSFNQRVQAEGTVWDLIPGIREGMFPHQQEGFEFIWKQIADSIFIEKVKNCTSDGGSGCIISHAPGTGKTRLTIMFLQTYMQLNPYCRPLIIAPLCMLLNWEQEFRKWNVGIPFHNLNSPDYSGQESAAAVNLKNNWKQGHNLDTVRLVKLLSWTSHSSVLGISYQLFEELANINVLIEKGKKEGKCKVAERIRDILLKFPGLLVLDEGHIPRNCDSQIFKAISEVQTQRRIMLSGTPFQNNFEELLNTFCLVRPKFCDEIISQAPRNGCGKRRKIKTAAKGKWALMTNNIGKHDDQKLEELKGKISEFVHVYKGTILQEKLPGLRDFMVVLHPTNMQKTLMQVVENNFQKNTYLKKGHLLSLISVHPALFSSDGLCGKESHFVRRDELEKLRPYPNAGVKTRFLMELIRLSWAREERVIVFSQYLNPLRLIMEQLRTNFHWAEGREILYMVGKHCEKDRQISINKLNDPESEVRVLLASSKACSEGINLVGASRVVLLDVVWNPSITRQAIIRAYRIGQKKVVYVYHLISGTSEWNKYKRQAGKDRISDLVFSTKDGAYKPESSYSVTEDKILHDMVQHESMRNIFEKILCQPKKSDLFDTYELVDEC